MTDKKSDAEAAKLFSVPDFVGDACKAIASRIRGAVAGVKFDDFHKVSCHCFQRDGMFYYLTRAPWAASSQGMQDDSEARSSNWLCS